MAMGRAEGREEEIALGEAQGREQGRKEEKIQLVKAMLKEKVDIEFISRITGLSKQEIKTVKEM